MQQAQKDQVLVSIKAFANINLDEILSSNFPDSKPSDTVVGDYTLFEFKSYTKKIFKQFEVELNSNRYKFLSFGTPSGNNYVGSNLSADLNNYTSNLNSGRFGKCAVILDELIGYQIRNDFWEKGKRKYFQVSEVEVNEAAERVELISVKLTKNTNLLELLNGQISEKKDELNSLITQKSSELEEIENLLQSARNNENQISEKNTSAAEFNVQISNVLENSRERKEEIDGIREKASIHEVSLSAAVKKYGTSENERNTTFEELNNNFVKRLEFVDSKADFFVERNDYLEDLIGREVGASLFETFKARKVELDKSTRFWRWAVPIAAIGLLIFIFVLFRDVDISKMSWQNLTVNSLKTLPIIGALLFAISQYGKERNFQEEYAFKSAMALTVKAYADQLKTEENKDKLILESVATIYKSPINSNSNKRDVKSAIGLLKEVKNLGKDIFPKLPK